MLLIFSNKHLLRRNMLLAVNAVYQLRLFKFRIAKILVQEVAPSKLTEFSFIKKKHAHSIFHYVLHMNALIAMRLD